MVDISVSNDLLQAAAERANQEKRSLTDVINTLMRDYAEGRTWLNLPDGEQVGERPPHGWDEIPEGYEVAAVPDQGWRVHDPGRRMARCCRITSRRGPCGRLPVAELNRPQRRRGKTFDAWWPYCLEHSYGRWIESGHVMCWILRKVADGG